MPCFGPSHKQKRSAVADGTIAYGGLILALIGMAQKILLGRQLFPPVCRFSFRMSFLFFMIDDSVNKRGRIIEINGMASQLGIGITERIERLHLSDEDLALRRGRGR